MIQENAFNGTITLLQILKTEIIGSQKTSEISWTLDVLLANISSLLFLFIIITCFLSFHGICDIFKKGKHSWNRKIWIFLKHVQEFQFQPQYLLAVWFYVCGQETLSHWMWNLVTLGVSMRKSVELIFAFQLKYLWSPEVQKSSVMLKIRTTYLKPASGRHS